MPIPTYSYQNRRVCLYCIMYPLCTYTRTHVLLPKAVNAMSVGEMFISYCICLFVCNVMNVMNGGCHAMTQYWAICADLFATFLPALKY